MIPKSEWDISKVIRPPYCQLYRFDLNPIAKYVCQTIQKTNHVYTVYAVYTDMYPDM